MTYFPNLIPPLLTLVSPTLVALEFNPLPNVDGSYSFEARAGEIVALEREISPGNPELCYPELVTEGKVEPLKYSVKPTPERESLLVRIQESGTYRYQVLAVPKLDLFAGERPEAMPYSPPKGHWCKVKVRLAEEYEKVWVEAKQAREEGEVERALSLYGRAIALEPKYPEPYQQSVFISLEIYHRNHPQIKGDNLKELGEFYSSMPETIKQPILDRIERVASIYEANPNWQTKPFDRPDFLRDWAIFIRTGVAADTVKEIYGFP